MRRILKFAIDPLGFAVRTATVPRWLAVDWQDATLVAWCEADPGDGVRTSLVAVGTGDAPPTWGTYIGTAQHPTLLGGGPLVLHVYAHSEPGDES